MLSQHVKNKVRGIRYLGLPGTWRQELCKQGRAAEQSALAVFMAPQRWDPHLTSLFCAALHNVFFLPFSGTVNVNWITSSTTASSIF